MKKSLIWSKLDLAQRRVQFLWEVECKSTEVYGCFCVQLGYLLKDSGTGGNHLGENSVYFSFLAKWKKKSSFSTSHIRALIWGWTSLLLEKACTVSPEVTQAVVSWYRSIQSNTEKGFYLLGKVQLCLIHSKVRLLATEVEEMDRMGLGDFWYA